MAPYPADWPRCPVCDDFALDGHITCGRAACDESRQRAERQRAIDSEHHFGPGPNKFEPGRGD